MTNKRPWSWAALTVATSFVLAACGTAPAAQTPPTTAPDAPVATTAPDAPEATTAPETPDATETTETPDTPDEPTAAPEAPEPSGEAGGRLRLLWWQAVTTLNPHLATGTKDFDGATVMLEPLAQFNGAGEPIPYLAEEIPSIENGGVSEDLLTTTWNLRQDVVWSDGTPFTADDVLFTYEYCADEATACTTSATFAQIASIEAVDDYTVQITWSEPNANYLSAFTGVRGMILQRAQFGNCIGAAASTSSECQAANNAPIGTGAFRLVEFRSGDVVLYERNPLYRDAENVFFDEVELKGGGDAVGAARAVCETGEIDYAWNLQVQRAVLDQIAAGGQCELLATASTGIERIVVNFANPDPALGELRSEPDQPHPFLTDPAVRNAIALAIDKNAIVEQLYGVTGQPTCNILVTPEIYNSPNTTCERDVEEANRLLDEAGYNYNGNIREKDGIPLIVSFQTSINALRQGEQAVIQSNLAEIGIRVDLKAIDAGVFFGGDPGNPDTLNKFYTDLQMYTNSNENPDPTDYFAGWLCEQRASSANQWNGTNDGRYCSEEYDATFAALVSATSADERAELLIALNDILIRDVAIIPLVNRFTPEGKANNLLGPEPTPFGSELWNIGTWSR